MKKLIIVAVSFVLCVSLTSCGKKPESVDEPVDVEQEVEGTYELELEPIDVADYLEDMGEVEATFTPNESNEVKDNTEVVDEVEDRGFGEFPVTAAYTMDGEYLGEDITTIENGKYPFYETYYISNSEELWTINIVNGTITAYPVTYNMESEREVNIIFSETSKLTSYDSVTNTFFEFIPDESVMKVVVVDRVDAETLDKLTKEEIDRY